MGKEKLKMLSFFSVLFYFDVIPDSTLSFPLALHSGVILDRLGRSYGGSGG